MHRMQRTTLPYPEMAACCRLWVGLSLSPAACMTSSLPAQVHGALHHRAGRSIGQHHGRSLHSISRMSSCSHPYLTSLPACVRCKAHNTTVQGAVSAATMVAQAAAQAAKNPLPQTIVMQCPVDVRKQVGNLP